MSFYDKKVIYLSYMEDGQKVKSAGYVKLEVFDEVFTMDMHLKAQNAVNRKKYEIFAESADKHILLGFVYLDNGEGSFQGQFPLQGIGRYEDKISYDEIVVVRVYFGERSYIEGRLQETKAKIENFFRKMPKVQAEIKASQDIHSSSVRVSEGDIRKELEEVKQTPNKWQQLLKTYKQIHPYGDNRVYVSIEPKDFVLLTEEYQHLAHNSFLLHGFYNYRHIILGLEQKGNQQTDGGQVLQAAQLQQPEQVYYLGVPGVYYEREKMVALMFGFEAFECEGGVVGNGKFGYYLKKVKI